ncbi:hypothetical protein ACOSQ4_011536 [Xanthoceras sorbifolium]
MSKRVDNMWNVFGRPYQMSLYPMLSSTISKSMHESPQDFRRSKHEFWMELFPVLELQGFLDCARMLDGNDIISH